MNVNIDSRRTILLVEGHPPERENIKKILVSKDFHVEETADYHGAVKYLGSAIPALVCLDLTLPRESGFELCEYMRSQNKRLLQV